MHWRHTERATMTDPQTDYQEMPHETTAEPHKPSIFRRLRSHLLAGILVTAPITLTVYLTYIFLTFVDAQVTGILPLDIYEAYYAHTTIPGIGLLIAVFFFIFVGWFARNFMGRMLIQVSEYIVHRLPVINALYKAVKQVMETLLGSQAQAFREVVMIEYPRKGTWTLGFVTGFTEGEIQDISKDDDLINVFVPTAPSPVNGFLLFVPKADMIPLKMSVEEGIKMVISMGIITPELPASKQSEKGVRRKK